MRFCRLLLLALIAVSAYSVPLQAKTVELAPSTPWNLHYDDDSCVLRRAFGNEDKFFQIELRRFSPTSGFQMAAYGSRLKGLNSIRGYRFFPNEKWLETRYSGGTFNKMKGTFLGFGVFPPDFEWEGEEPMPEKESERVALEYAAKIRKLELRVLTGDNLSLEIGPLDQPLEAMMTCLDELMTHWGLQPEAQNSLSRRPVPVNLAAVTRMMDYPPRMMQRGMIGIVNVRLGVTEQGLVSDCKVQLQLSDPTFEEYACGDLRHSMEFEPALDAEGKPIASFWTTTVHYKMN